MRKTIQIISLLLPFAFLQAQDQMPSVDYKTLPLNKRARIMEKWRSNLDKAAQEDDRYDSIKEVIINGNQIKVLLTNLGSLSSGNADNIFADLFWPRGAGGLGYAYEFGPMVAAEVVNDAGDTLHIVNDGFFDAWNGDFEPGTANRWGWRPRKGFSDPANPELAHFSDDDSDGDDKPDSWPEEYFNENLGRYVWPAFLGDDATTPDEEVFYVLDDFSNAEFPYYPFPEDSSKRGLGLDIQVRIFQFNNELAEDIIFLVYTITNVSSKPLNKVWLGMFGDPHVGGIGDFTDDYADFISKFDERYPFKARNMLFAFDEPAIGDGGLTTGYFGYKFLESPGIDNDGVDNDNDGLLDESQLNDAGELVFGPVGIYDTEAKEHWSGDEDGDWDANSDDVGVDGIAGTGDFGEGDGRPNQLFYLDLNDNSLHDPDEPTSVERLHGYRFLGGEPNFGVIDVAESDQLGLTSFNALLEGGNNRPKNDELMYEVMSTDNQRPSDPLPKIFKPADNVFIYGSGPFSLQPGESQRFSIALMMGNDITDLVQNATISQDIFESDYRFAIPPKKPQLIAVPGDGNVHLYWDAEAEQSFDPFVARINPENPDAGFDFEGYKIYRSRDPSFNDTKTITDGRGIPFLSRPLEDQRGIPAVFDIRDNGFEGFSEVAYPGRGGLRYYLGDNTGLAHSYVDSNNVVNGVTYFYAVTAYDHGDVEGKMPPSETQRNIQRNPLTRKFKFDVNTAMVIPGPLAANSVDAGIDSEDNLAQQITGDGTGLVQIDIINPVQVLDGNTYSVTFDSADGSGLSYSVINGQEMTETFTAKDTFFVNLNGRNLSSTSVKLTDSGGNEITAERYILLLAAGRIRGKNPGDLPIGQDFTIQFRVAEVSGSVLLGGEDGNPIFDGVRVRVQDEPVDLNPAKSGFKISQNNSNFSVQDLSISPVGGSDPAPIDFEIVFSDWDTTTAGDLRNPADSSSNTSIKSSFKIKRTDTGERVGFRIIQRDANLRNGRWDYSEHIEVLDPRPDAPINAGLYRLSFDVPRDTVYTTGGAIDTIHVATPVYPGDGDIFFIFSNKSFDSDDEFAFSTRALSFSDREETGLLENVYAVPNPYIAFSYSEIAGPGVGMRDDRRLEFRNLPQKCTIRIYTIIGELVRTIEKDDVGSVATWNLLSSESQRIAYGVYIYHVDAPGIGTKTGRIGIIK